MIEDTAAPTASGDDGADWGPEQVEPETGVALDGDGLPVNHRLRAERLARDGKTTDAGGLITDDLIAATASRLDDDDKAAEVAKREVEEQFPPVRVNMRTDDLVAIAERETVDLSAASNNQDRVDAIVASRTLRGITVDATGEGETN